MPSEARRCEWLTLQQAIEAFVLNATGHQGQEHIRPLHHHVACRLVVEGGFKPSDVTPHPPLRIEERPHRRILHYDESAASGGEGTVLGGLKTKAVDVVVTRPHIGPVLAVSMKGTLGAFRNLTNRMEEAVGDCTNLHIAYPALVYGYLQVLRATVASVGVQPNDVCVQADGTVAESIARYHDVLTRLDGRRDLRDDPSKYEAVSLSLAKPDEPGRGTLLPAFPLPTSPLTFSAFFEKLYRAYDLRFVYAAPKLESITARSIWDPASPALQDPRASEYVARAGD